jgi:hypothetical protein
MNIEKIAKDYLDRLLEMSQENFTEMSERWSDLDKDSLFSIRNSKDFQIGYVFGKIEHKFISWFYSEYGRAQTDEEYEEFFIIINKKISKTNNTQSGMSD